MRIKRCVWATALLACMLAMTGCAQGRGTAGAPLPTVVLGGAGSSATQRLSSSSAPLPTGDVVVSDVVAPARQADLAFGASGQVADVTVAEGDVVSAGQTMLRLDERAAQAQLAQARALLDQAEANHAAMAAGPTDEELRQAQSAVDAAQATLAALEAQPRAENVTQAEANLASAEAMLSALTEDPTPLELEAARVAIDEAKDTLWAAQSTRDAVCGSRSLSGAECDASEAQVLVAEGRVRQAEILLEQLQQGADGQTIVQAQQAVRVAQAQLDLARAPVTVHELAAARAQVDAAEAALAALTKTPRPEAIAAAAAQVALARAQVDAAQAALDTLRVVAPFGGTLVDVPVHTGEWVQAGQQAAALADVSHLVVKTTDLSELDVPAIAVGQPATILVEALAARLTGRVASIAPLADTLGGDVVYEATIELDQQPAGLRAGMTAEVSL